MCVKIKYMFSLNTQPLPGKSQNLISQTSGFPEILILHHQQARTKQFPDRCHRYDIFHLKPSNDYPMQRSLLSASIFAGIP